MLGKIADGREAVKKIVIVNPKADPVPNPESCDFTDLFDHKLFNMMFSDIRKIIKNNWSQLGKGIQAHGMDRERFNMYMIDLNAGRTDADHYDPEDRTSPEEWEITNETLEKFRVAYNEIEKVLISLRL